MLIVKEKEDKLDFFELYIVMLHIKCGNLLNI